MVLHAWQEAISEYTGTVITVSHDRYFVKQIVNRVIEVKDQTIQDYKGDYNVSSHMIFIL
jgi:ATPase subunit of ABC transporter with duplicated ATPase domains